jgi:hypothetical protein
VDGRVAGRQAGAARLTLLCLQLGLQLGLLAPQLRQPPLQRVDHKLLLGLERGLLLLRGVPEAAGAGRGGVSAGGGATGLVLTSQACWIGGPPYGAR